MRTAHTDPFLKNKTFKFSIDEIYPLPYERSDVFGVTVIPDIKSRQFPPWHLRTINVVPELLEQRFYSTFNLDSEEVIDFNSSVVQGGYYEVETSLIDPNIFKEEYVVTLDKNIFSQSRLPKSKFTELEHHPVDRRIYGVDDVDEIFSVWRPIVKLAAVYIYCFNVGQGDSTLLILPSGRAYLIDTNYYNGRQEIFANKINYILRKHNLEENSLKGIVLTHKHLDHIRGLDYLFNNFKVDYFIVNLDYEHPTKPVQDLFVAASKSSCRWINLNDISLFEDCGAHVWFVNPDKDTKDTSVCPNINDSSIGIYLEYGRSRVFLTGDAGYKIIENKFPSSTDYCHFGFHNSESNLFKCHNRLLKVAHHGSATGTNYSLLNHIRPTHSFVSAGESRRYRHPHKEVIDEIKKCRCSPELMVSKEIGHPVCYEVSLGGIVSRLV